MNAQEYWPKYDFYPTISRLEEPKTVEETYEDIGNYLTVFISEDENRFRCENLAVFKKQTLGINGELFDFKELKEKFNNEGFYITIPNDCVLKVADRVVIKVADLGTNFIDYEEFEKEVIDKIKQVEGKKTSLQEFKELTKHYKNTPEEKDLDFLKSIFNKIPLFRVGFASRMNDSIRDGMIMLKEKFSHEDLYSKDGIDYTIC